MEYTWNDRVLLGWIAGLLGLITRDVYSFLAKIVGLAKFYVWDISTDLFINGKEVHTILGNVIGITADLIFGGILGILFAYFLKMTSSKYLILKSLGFGVVAWLFLFGLMLHNLPMVKTAPGDALSNFSAFIGHSIFGISTGVFMKKLLAKYGLLSDRGR